MRRKLGAVVLSRVAAHQRVRSVIVTNESRFPIIPDHITTEAGNPGVTYIYIYIYIYVPVGPLKGVTSTDHNSQSERLLTARLY